MATRTRFSKFGLPYGSAVDVAALSDKAAAKNVSFAAVVGAQPASANTAYFTINQSNDHFLGFVNEACTVVSAKVASGRATNLGTGSYSLYKSTDGSTKTLITDTVNSDTVTAFVPSSFTMVTASSANVLAAGDQLWLRCTADNNTVTTDASAVKVMVQVIPTDTTPTRGGASAFGT